MKRRSHAVAVGLQRAVPWAAFAAILLAGALAYGAESGPQTEVPAPRPGGDADVPGGAAKNGIIRPPSTGGTMPVIPPPAEGTMPVIPPPGTPENQPDTQPK